MRSSLRVEMVKGETPQDPESMRDLMNREMLVFNDWLRSQGEAPLTKFEEAMVRTYLVRHLRGELSGGEA